MGDEQVLLMKEDMKRTLDWMSHENLDDCFGLLTSQFDIIKRLYEIEKVKGGLGLLPGEVTADLPVVVDTVVDTVVGSVVAEPERDDAAINYEQTSERKMYRVDRKLKGAYVDDIAGYVPETVLRQQNIDHGDYVYAEPIPSTRFGQNRFRYELAQKSNEAPAVGRIEHKGCAVKKDGDLLVVTRSSVTGETIKIDDTPYVIALSEHDIAQHDLVEGDVIDIAFYESNPMTATVIWKYDTSDIVEPEKTERRKSAYRKDDADDGPDIEIEQVFTGKTICVVGDKPSESLYKKLIEERGGSHIHVEPKWGIKRIQTHVKNSDVVVGLYDVSGHTGLEKTKAYCKRYGVPYKMIPGKGKSSVIQTAVDLLAETS